MRRTNTGRKTKKPLSRLRYKLTISHRPSRTGTTGYLECLVTHSGERARFTLTPYGAEQKDFAIPSADWDSKEKRACGTNFETINDRLNEVHQLVREYFQHCDDEATPPDMEYLRRHVTGQPSDSGHEGAFFQLFQKFIDDYQFVSPQRIKVSLSHNTKLTYRTILRALQSFEEYRSRTSVYRIPISITDFAIPRGKNGKHDEPIIVSEFKDYLQNVRKYNGNSLSKAHKCLVKVLRWMQEKGFAGRRELYTSTSGVRFEAESETLQEHELNALTNLDLVENSTLWHVRNLFVLACHHSQRFSDWHKLDANRWCERYQMILTQKTAHKAQVIHTPELREILRLYAGKAWPSMILPSEKGVMTMNAKVNLWVKEVCKLAGLDRKCDVERFIGTQKVITTKPLYELVTTHTARRTKITLCLLNGGSPSALAMETGHKSLHQLRPQGPYLRLDPEAIANKLGITEVHELQPPKTSRALGE